MARVGRPSSKRLLTPEQRRNQRELIEKFLHALRDADTDRALNFQQQHFVVIAKSSNRNQPVQFSTEEESRIIEMAWEDRTPFEAIDHQFGLNESQVIDMMRRSLRASSFRLWRRRVSGRATKHGKLRRPGITRGYCPTQYKHR